MVLGKRLGIDLGASATRLVVKGEATVIDEPAVVATRNGESFFGLEALKSQDTARSLSIAEGVIADERALNSTMHYLFNKAIGRQRIFKPDVMLAVAASMNTHDRQKLLAVVTEEGAKTSYLLDATLAAALGGGVDIANTEPQLIVHIGSSLVEIAVLSKAATLHQQTLTCGGQQLTDAIREAVHATQATAESIKQEVANALPPEKNENLTFTDGDHEVTVNSNDLRDTVQAWVEQLVLPIRQAIESVPETIQAKLKERAILLTGGGAQLQCLAPALSKLLGVDCQVVEAPAGAVIRGTAIALDHFDVIKKSFLYIR